MIIKDIWALEISKCTSWSCIIIFQPCVTGDFLLPSSSRSSQNALDKSSGPRESCQYSTGIFFNISMETSLQATAGDIPNTKQVFLPQETLDHPFDVTLVIQNGKEFKAHRRVLSEASPFFERLLKSDMKEAIEGIIHLEMIHKECLCWQLSMQRPFFHLHEFNI